MSCSALCSICLESRAFPEQLLFFAACACRTPSCRHYPPRKIFVDLIISEADRHATAPAEVVNLQKQKFDNARMLAELREVKDALESEQRRVRALEEERDRTKIECIWMKQERDRTREEHDQRTKERDELLRELREADEKLAAMQIDNREMQRVAIGSKAQRRGLNRDVMQDCDELGAHERVRMEDIKALQEKNLELFRELMEQTLKIKSLSEPDAAVQSAQVQHQSARVVRRGGAGDLRERFYIAAAEGHRVEAGRRAEAGHRVTETREVPRTRTELRAQDGLSGGVFPPTVDSFPLTENPASSSISFSDQTMEAILYSLRNHE
uniref:Uncharacterized protein n=1 Tax=Schizophyllum commune (strain H4-8 / FGSC 9210) TaxID=578458 RepID=D8QB86_SCHCM